MFSLIGQLAQQTYARILELLVTGAVQLPHQAPSPFSSVWMPYYTTTAPLGTVAPPVGMVPPLPLVIGLGMTSLLASSVAKPISASVAQPHRPDDSLHVATLVTEASPAMDMMIASPYIP